MKITMVNLYDHVTSIFSSYNIQTKEMPRYPFPSLLFNFLNFQTMEKGNYSPSLSFPPLPSTLLPLQTSKHTNFWEEKFFLINFPFYAFWLGASFLIGIFLVDSLVWGVYLSNVKYLCSHVFLQKKSNRNV